MGKIKKYIDMIVEKGKEEDMECLGEMMVDLIDDMKHEHYNKYNEYKQELCGMAYDYKIDEEMGKEIVEHMEPYGECWSIEQTSQVKRQYGLDNIRDVDFYVVMNSAKNDYYDLFKDNVDYYVQFTKMFIHDEDSDEHKVWKYFTTIPREE